MCTCVPNMYSKKTKYVDNKKIYGNIFGKWIALKFNQTSKYIKNQKKIYWQTVLVFGRIKHVKCVIYFKYINLNNTILSLARQQNGINKRENR